MIFKSAMAGQGAYRAGKAWTWSAQVHSLLAQGVGLLECTRRLQLALNTFRYSRADRPKRMSSVPDTAHGRHFPCGHRHRVKPTGRDNTTNSPDQ